MRVANWLDSCELEWPVGSEVFGACCGVVIGSEELVRLQRQDADCTVDGDLCFALPGQVLEIGQRLWPGMLAADGLALSCLGM